MGPNVNDLRANLMAISRETQTQADIAMLTLSALGIYFCPYTALLFGLTIGLIMLSYFLNGRLIMALLDYTEDPKNEWHKRRAKRLESVINNIGYGTMVFFITGVIKIIIWRLI